MTINGQQDLEKEVTIKEQILFFLPLAMTSFLIIVTHSLFNAGLARLPSPAIYIAAFAVAKSLMHILQSPVNMIRQTVTVLIQDRQSYHKTRGFLVMLVLVVVICLGIIAMTDMSRWIFENVMGLSGRTLDEAITMLKILFIFPGLVSIREFYFGICIRFRINPLITLASFIRVIYVIIFVLLINKITVLSGAALASIMFLGAVAIEVLVMFLGTKLIIRNIPKNLEFLKNRMGGSLNKLTYKYIFAFFSPLAITAYIQTTAMPIINGSLARTYQPEIAISVFAVAWGLGFIFLSPFTIFHQLPLNYINEDNNANMKSVKKFAVILGVSFSLIMVLISFTDIGYYILSNFIGTNHEISILSVDVLKLMSLLPLLMVAREFYWGILMKRRMTRYIARGKIINIVTLVIVVIATTIIGPSNPAIIGVVGIIGCELSEFLYLYYIARKNNKI